MSTTMADIAAGRALRDMLISNDPHQVLFAEVALSLYVLLFVVCLAVLVWMLTLNRKR